MLEAGTSLTILATLLVVVAIVGGDVSLPGGTKFGPLASRQGRIVLAAFAVGMGVVGVLFVLEASHRSDDGGLEASSRSKMDYTNQVRSICLEADRSFSELGIRPDGPMGDWRDAYKARGVVLDELLFQARSVPVPPGDDYHVYFVWIRLQMVIEAEEAYYSGRSSLGPQLAWLNVEETRSAYSRELRQQNLPVECMLSRTCDRGPISGASHGDQPAEVPRYRGSGR